MTPLDPCYWRCTSRETHPIRFRVVVFDSFARSILACDAGVPRRRGGLSGSGRLPLPRDLIGGERGIGTGRGCDELC